MPLHEIGGIQMHLLSAVVPTQNSGGLEFYLLRTIPRVRIIKNLKMRVLKIPGASWEIPPSGIYPRTCEIPFKLRILDERPALSPMKACLLMTEFEGEPIESYRTWLPLGQSNAYKLGLSWTCSSRTESFLGKRQLSAQPQPTVLPRHHKLVLSHMGVTQLVPQSRSLDLSFEKIAANLFRLCGEDPAECDRRFRLRFDEVTHLVEVAFYSRNQDSDVVEARGVYFYSSITERRKRKPEEYYEEEDTPLPDWVEFSVPVVDSYQDFDNSWLSVYTTILELLSRKQIGSECGILQLLNKIVASIIDWVQIYQGTSVVPLDQDLEELISPFTTLIQWLEPIESLFLSPLIRYFLPGKFGGYDSLDSSVETLPDRDWYVPEYTWQSCIYSYHKFIKIKYVLTEVRSTRNLKLLTEYCRCEDSSSFEYPAFPFKQIMAFLHKAVQDVEVYERLRKCFEQPLSEFRTKHSEEIQSSHTIRKVELSIEQLGKLIRQFIRPIVRFRKNDETSGLVRVTNRDWATLRSVGGAILPIKVYGKPSTTKSYKMTQAIKFKNIMMLFPRSSAKDGFEAMVVNTRGVCSSHWIKTEEMFTDKYELSEDKSFFAEPDVPDEYVTREGRSYLFRAWSDGLLVWFRDREDQTISLNVLSFRPCLAGSKEAPQLHTLLLNGDLIGLEGMKFNMHNDLWTVAFDTICLLVTAPCTLPVLLACRVTQDGVSLPHKIEWVPHFTQEQIKDLSYCRMIGNYQYNANIIAAQDSRTLFMSFLQPEQDRKPGDKRDPDRDLWIVCFRSKSRFAKLCYVTKNLYKVCIEDNQEHRWGNYPQRYPLETKIIHIRKRDFLLLSPEKRPLRAFTLQGNRLIQISLNGNPTWNLPKLPGRMIWGGRLLTNHFSAFSVVTQHDQLSGKTLLEFYTVKLTV